MTTHAPEILTLEELASYLRIGTRTAYRLVSTGAIPAAKVGGQWRISRLELDAQLSASAHSKGGEPGISER
jgi:excisionase family DNA binding protein